MNKKEFDNLIHPVALANTTLASFFTRLRVALFGEIYQAETADGLSLTTMKVWRGNYYWLKTEKIENDN